MASDQSLPVTDPDRDIERAAHYMLDQFGEDAPFHAARRAHELTKTGYPAAAAHWDKVHSELDRLCQMMTDTAPIAAALRRADVVIRQQEQRLERQRLLVESFEKQGQSGLTLLARRLLANFTEALASSRRFRALRRAEIGLPTEDHETPAPDARDANKRTAAGDGELFRQARDPIA